MSLTTAQLATLKTAIAADASIAADVAAGNIGKLADYYNVVPPSSPTKVWRPAIPIAEINTAITWSEFAALSQALRDTFAQMTRGAVVDATSSSIRAGFALVFAGTTTLTALTALAQQNATRLEALFVSAGVSSVFGTRATTDDIQKALA